ncbi:MAG: zinc ribbon domain-containing protein [Dehalococcoidia bacterium]|nr:zinc ribbon domain-containing protein [Dehalococcoidia bacterium]
MTWFLFFLALLTFAFIAYPFYRKRLRHAEYQEDGQLVELLSKRDTSYSMLKELEFDYKSGILTEKDYKELESRYKRKAINILKDMDSAQDGQKIGDEIEEQVNKLRHNNVGKGSKVSDEIEEEVDRLRGEKAVNKQLDDQIEEQVQELREKPRYCRKCGVKVREDDVFCSRCGAKLI